MTHAGGSPGEALKAGASALPTRPLHFIWIIDCSDAMAGRKIEALNLAIREAIPTLQDLADSDPHASLLIRAIRYGDGASWHVAEPTPIEAFSWTDLRAGGACDMGAALKLTADALRMEKMAKQCQRPMLVLTTGGTPTDDFGEGLRALADQPWGRKSVRSAVAIGNGADLDALQRFLESPEIQPLAACDLGNLVNRMKWTTNDMARQMPTAEAGGAAARMEAVPPPPCVSDCEDVF